MSVLTTLEVLADLKAAIAAIAAQAQRPEVDVTSDALSKPLAGGYDFPCHGMSKAMTRNLLVMSVSHIR